ncbi:uncharacterized protein LOC118433988 [Folsomia candida]|nr:uncharacterized protein LOC118433988 [Folsomia candida]
MILSCAMFPCVVTVDAYFNPRPYFLTSLVVGDNFLLKLTLLFGQMWIYSCENSVVVAHAVTFITFSTATHAILFDMRPNRKNYQTYNSLRRPRDLVLCYKGFAYLVTIFNEIYRDVAMPANNVFTLVTVLSNFAIIRNAHDHSAYFTVVFCALSLFSGFAWSTILTFSSKLSVISNGTINSWKYFQLKNASDAKYLSKIRKSCRPMRLACGGFYYIDPIRVFRFAHSILWGTLRIKLLLK